MPGVLLLLICLGASLGSTVAHLRWYAVMQDVIWKGVAIVSLVVTLFLLFFLMSATVDVISSNYEAARGPVSQI